MGDKTEFTPGPWRKDKETFAGGCDVIEDTYHIIEAGNGHADDGFSLSGYMSIADCALIAAAPELYAALDRMTSLLNRVGDSRKDAEIIEAARAALAKARGEMP
jgi:hypothetical protein